MRRIMPCEESREQREQREQEDEAAARAKDDNSALRPSTLRDTTFPFSFFEYIVQYYQ